MKYTNTILSIFSILFGVMLGYLLFGSRTMVSDAPMQMHHSATDHSMMHSEIIVDERLPIPTISLEASKDTKDGYNIYVNTEHFVFTPENVNASPIPNEGHAHLYINDIKIGRVYGPWIHISNTLLKDGKNSIEVTLNANDHSDWIHNNAHIAASVMVVK